jgi:hypothetical protein
VAGGWAYRLWIQTVPSPAQPSGVVGWGGVGAGDEPAACRFKLIPVQHGVVVGWVAGGIVSCRLKELDSTFRLVVGWAGLKP